MLILSNLQMDDYETQELVLAESSTENLGSCDEKENNEANESEVEKNAFHQVHQDTCETQVEDLVSNNCQCSKLISFIRKLM